MKKKAKVIAFYLPQYHPCKDNDEWWGKGFTEWRNVGKAKPLFHGHKQPKVPSELGYYDLRLEEVREAQAQLAKDAGIECFCYWHYWMGGGKQLLERPLQEVLEKGKPNFPFCLGWANHSWVKKFWSADVSRFNQEMLLEQTYPGRDDIDAHFYKMLPAFKDKRYYRIHNRLCFLIYNPIDLPDLDYFIERWNELAQTNGLPDFYFLGHTSISDYKNPINTKFDAIVLSTMELFFNESFIKRFLSFITKSPIRTNYKKILKINDLSVCKEQKIYPCIYPNWDKTPRVGPIGTVFTGSTPELFKKHVEQVIQSIQHKPEEDKIIFLKSWNEWAEGNYMEPDIEFGRGYIRALADVIFERTEK